MSQIENSRLVLLDVNKQHLEVVSRDSGELLLRVDDIGYPDGVQVDTENGYFYWTDMGPDRQVEDFFSADGSVWRSDLNGQNITRIAGNGAIYTPKQLQLDQENQRLYWCDREGGRVMCCQTDGRELTTLVESSTSPDYPRDKTEQCVGIVLDKKNGHVYWTQKGPQKAGKGRLFRAGITLPAGEQPANRSDIELLADHLPEPIDLEIDHTHGYLYWTDRGAEPDGNSLNRARITADGIKGAEVLVRGFHEAIGLALDTEKALAYVADLSGKVFEINLETMEKSIFYQGGIGVTGIAIF